VLVSSQRTAFITTRDNAAMKGAGVRKEATLRNTRKEEGRTKSLAQGTMRG